jgi:hypothetical protein
MQLVTIYTAFTLTDADLIRSRLEAADFHPVIIHGDTASSLGGMSLGAGAIVVQVPEDEAADVRELLGRTDDAPPA